MTVEILVGDARARLAGLPDASVHCVVTSPPYFGLRDYDADGQIGLELTPDEYITTLVEVFREVRRVLRADGTLWLNIGDSYAGSWGAQGRRETDADVESWHGSQIKNHPKRASRTGSIRAAGVKPKDLYGIPWLLAFALRADGWWLRQDNIWSKPNAMPESVTDRCTKAHEYLFFLTKSEKYFYDAEAIAEPALIESAERYKYRFGGPKNVALTATEQDGAGSRTHPIGNRQSTETRNKRSVWSIATQPYAEAHFATMPPALVEPCILAGTSAKGCCATCGAPWVRIVEKTRTRNGKPLAGDWGVNDGGVRLPATGVGHWRDKTATETIGWEPSCACLGAGDRVPATVLDPFGGSGTVGLVSDRLQRNAILIDLNPKYAQMAQSRIADEAGGMFGQAAVIR